jgi:DNA-directed RNA polymerase subunit E'/Rpb7
MSLYSPAILTRKITLHINNLGSDPESVIQTHLAFLYEGKCSNEGFIKQKSIKLTAYSAGRISDGVNICFDVAFSCEVCYPLAGLIISCIATNITKAGIRAEVASEANTPLVIFVARDHYYSNDAFSQVKVNDKISIKVIGNRFELNDKHVYVIAELADANNDITQSTVEDINADMVDI